MQGIASTVETGLVDAIEGAINGTKTLGDVARSVFGEIQRSAYKFGAMLFLVLCLELVDFSEQMVV